MEIDGVFSGGGVKGFALIGAYEAIEEKGFRFKRLTVRAQERSLLRLLQRDLQARKSWT